MATQTNTFSKTLVTTTLFVRFLEMFRLRKKLYAENSNFVDSAYQVDALTKHKLLRMNDKILLRNEYLGYQNYTHSNRLS
ncbi:MAG: hypothetical protein ACXADH_18670 [Candidatus Kariarchaeaceae archaeon]